MKGNEIAVVSVQEQALIRVNVTESVLKELELKYAGLKINGIDDNDGLKAVRNARIECKNLRVLADKICKEGREEAVKEQKLWLAEAKLVIGRIESVEIPLKEEEERVKAELDRIKKEREEAYNRMIAERMLKFQAVGAIVSYDDVREMYDN